MENKNKPKTIWDSMYIYMALPFIALAFSINIAYLAASVIFVMLAYGETEKHNKKIKNQDSSIE